MRIHAGLQGSRVQVHIKLNSNAVFGNTSGHLSMFHGSFLTNPDYVRWLQPYDDSPPGLASCLSSSHWRICTSDLAITHIYEPLMVTTVASWLPALILAHNGTLVNCWFSWQVLL
jgi:hypothetical protein